MVLDIISKVLIATAIAITIFFYQKCIFLLIMPYVRRGHELCFEFSLFK